MRYAIKHADGYFTGSDIVGNRDSIEVDGAGTKYVHQRHILVPKFDGNARDCARYGSEEDAKTMMSHAFLQDPNAFEGCTVVPVD